MIIHSNQFKFDLNNYDLRISWLYLGKYLTNNKYSINYNVSNVKRPKSSILIIILLFMCGDTGVSINPGPLSPNYVNFEEVNLNERYLNDIDPDLNYFNEAEYSHSNFKSYTVDEFKDKHLNSPPSLNIMHHNC